MKITGSISLEMEDIQAAIAEYVNRVYRINVQPAEVRVYPNPGTGISAFIDANVDLKREEEA